MFYCKIPLLHIHTPVLSDVIFLLFFIFHCLFFLLPFLIHFRHILLIISVSLFHLTHCLFNNLKFPNAYLYVYMHNTCIRMYM